MKLISLDNLRTFKNKLNFGTLENDYYIAGVHKPDISKCKIVFPLKQGYRNYSYNTNGGFSTSNILISEFKEFLNLFASFSKNKYIYAHSGSFIYMYDTYTFGSNSEIRIESNGNLFFNISNSNSKNLSLGPYELITNVYLVLSDSVVIEK